MSLSTLKPEDMDLEVCLAAYENAKGRGHWALQHLGMILPSRFPLAELEKLSAGRHERCA
jgi:hypothetical protein